MFENWIYSSTQGQGQGPISICPFAQEGKNWLSGPQDILILDRVPERSWVSWAWLQQKRVGSRARASLVASDGSGGRLAPGLLSTLQVRKLASWGFRFYRVHPVLGSMDAILSDCLLLAYL